MFDAEISGCSVFILRAYMTFSQRAGSLQLLALVQKGRPVGGAFYVSGLRAAP